MIVKARLKSVQRNPFGIGRPRPRTGRPSVRSTAVILAISIFMLAMTAASASALTEAPGWELSGTTYPTNFVSGVDEVLEVTPEAATFELSYEGESTGAIPAKASASTVQSDLEALPNIGAGNVAVVTAGEGYRVTFVKALGNMQISGFGSEGASLSLVTEGSVSGTIGIDVFNIGAGESSGPITITDDLPAGLKAKFAGEARQTR